MNKDTRYIQERIFLVGCPRSGTTLLQSMLMGHPQVESFPETHFFERGFRGRRNLLLRTFLRGRYLHSIMADFISELEDNGYTLPPLNITPKWSKDKMVKSFINLLDALTLEKDKSLWLEKTPGHLKSIDKIEHYVEGAKFIHIIRDGRPVVASLYKASRLSPKDWGGAYSLKKCVALWNSSVEITSRYCEEDDHLAVSYEHLLVNPKKELKKICRFMNIDYVPAMVADYAINAKKVISNSEAWKVENMHSLEDKGLTKFEMSFNDKKRSVIENSLHLSVYYNIYERIN